MDPKKHGRTDTAGMGNDDGITFHTCYHVGHISRNCSSCELMTKRLERALVGKDAPRVQYWGPYKDPKKEAEWSSQNERGQCAFQYKI